MKLKHVVKYWYFIKSRNSHPDPETKKASLEPVHQHFPGPPLGWSLAKSTNHVYISLSFSTRPTNWRVQGREKQGELTAQSGKIVNKFIFPFYGLFSFSWFTNLGSQDLASGLWSPNKHTVTHWRTEDDGTGEVSFLSIPLTHKWFYFYKFYWCATSKQVHKPTHFYKVKISTYSALKLGKSDIYDDMRVLFWICIQLSYLMCRIYSKDILSPPLHFHLLDQSSKTQRSVSGLWILFCWFTFLSLLWYYPTLIIVAFQ